MLVKQLWCAQHECDAPASNPKDKANDDQHTIFEDPWMYDDPWMVSSPCEHVPPVAPSTPKGRRMISLDDALPETPVFCQHDILQDLQIKLNAVEVELKQTRDQLALAEKANPSSETPRSPEQSLKDLASSFSDLQVEEYDMLAQLCSLCLPERPMYLDQPMASMVKLVQGMEKIKMDSMLHRNQQLLDEKNELMITLASHSKAAMVQKQLVDSIRDDYLTTTNAITKDADSRISKAQQALISQELEHSSQIRELECKLEAHEDIYSKHCKEIVDLHLRIKRLSDISTGGSSVDEKDKFPSTLPDGLDSFQHEDGSCSSLWRPGCIDELHQCNGILAILTGLKSEKHNGQKGVLKSYDHITGRVEFCSTNGVTLAVKVANIVTRVDFDAQGRGSYRKDSSGNKQVK